MSQIINLQVYLHVSNIRKTQKIWQYEKMTFLFRHRIHCTTSHQINNSNIIILHFFQSTLTCILIWWSCERFIPKNDEINPKLKNIESNKHSVHDIWLLNRVSKMFSIIFQFCSLRNSQISWVLFSTVYILATSKSHLYT